METQKRKNPVDTIKCFEEVNYSLCDIEKVKGYIDKFINKEIEFYTIFLPDDLLPLRILFEKT